MKILSINSGSQTLKYQLFELKGFKLIKKGAVSDIGFGAIKNHREALRKILTELDEHKKEIKLIGHRYVNGGKFIEPTVMNKKIVSAIEQYNNLAPLHNPANLEGIKASLNLLPEALNVAVFDTCFYKDLPKKAYTYAINKRIQKKYGYRRYGFHGTSHKYVVNEAARLLGKDLDELKLISIHLGGGASITATKYGRAIDTSMGYTPAEGLVMMTRCGDIDAGILIDLMRQGYDSEEIDKLVNMESGLYGLCGKKGMLEILESLDEQKIKDAFEVYIYRLRKYLGAYFAALNGCNAVIFTGSVGSGAPITREKVVKDLDILKDVEILPIETNEELMIAKDAYLTYKNSQ
ncbi:MAG: acetate/propionate family kinase [Candidatus Moranbacteria bacterium]|nr:acetate/propionate family kinase [Candidatus Moranbacteria bacterium]